MTPQPSAPFRRARALFLTILSSTVCCLAQSKPSAIGPSGVWQAPQNFVSMLNTACGSPSQERKYADCFMGQMAKAGASANAVAFTRELSKQRHGDLGIMTSFQHVGPVDIAWVLYPTHQPSNYGLFLVNGDPRLVNAEDLKLLDQKAMQQSFQYQGVQNQFPQVGLWPGDRDGKTWPNSQARTNGGVQFVLGYPLRNGCATCAHAGSALFTWNFDARGKFTGTSFMGLTPAPLTGQTPAQ